MTTIDTKPKVVYTDDGGNQWIGYSPKQIADLKRVIVVLAVLLSICVLMMVIWTVLGIALFRYADYHNILSNVVEKCVC